MTLKLTFATEQDASRIADIHMAAFATNAMLIAQFPSSAVREGLRISIACKTTDDIRDSHIAVLLVRDTDLNDEVISYAKWSLPSSTSGNEAPWIWPEGTRLDILNQWTEKVDRAKKKILGDERCYRTPSTLVIHSQSTNVHTRRRCKQDTHHLTYKKPGLTLIATHPEHERRGASTMLIRWALDRCRKEGVPAQLESTATALTLYQRMGFMPEEGISMMLEDGTVYEEVGYLFRPGAGVARQTLARE